MNFPSSLTDTVVWKCRHNKQSALPSTYLLLPSFAARLFSLRRISIELEGSGIDAVTQSRRCRSILEYMTEVPIAAGAQHFYPSHEMAVIFLINDIFRPDRLPERRPSRTGIEFGIRVKQGGATAGATIHSLIVTVPVFTCKCSFRPFFPAYVILLRGQLIFPFLIGFNKFVAHIFSRQKLTLLIRAMMRSM